MTIPHDALALLQHFSPVFTQPSYRRFLVLVVAAVLTTGRRTVSNLLRTLGTLAPGDPSSYQRFFSHARWSALALACVLTRLLVKTFYRRGVIYIAGDDTVTEHRGKKVYGKGRHRDAVRSSQSYTAHRYGHKWVVAAVLVRLPLTWRWWALPVLVDLYLPPGSRAANGRRHRTPAQRMARLLRVLLRWFPERRWIFAGDGGFGTHELARFAHAHQQRLSLVSRFQADANLYEPPPARQPGQTGRPRVKGAKLPSPQAVVAGAAQRQRLRVHWYGGGRRTVDTVTGTGHWYKSGAALVEVRWVYVHDVSGTHRDDYLFSTNTGLTARQIIEIFTRRWNLETTFQELRSYVGLESTCGRTRATVSRAEPCLFGLYSLVVLLHRVLPASLSSSGQVRWSGKEALTFSDALTAVRRWWWTSCIFETAGHDQAFAKIPEELRDILLNGLTPAA